MSEISLNQLFLVEIRMTHTCFDLTDGPAGLSIHGNAGQRVERATAPDYYTTPTKAKIFGKGDDIIVSFTLPYAKKAEFQKRYYHIIIDQTLNSVYLHQLLCHYRKTMLHSRSVRQTFKDGPFSTEANIL
jgi:hypothetical protein